MVNMPQSNPFCCCGTPFSQSNIFHEELSNCTCFFSLDSSSNHYVSYTNKWNSIRYILTYIVLMQPYIQFTIPSLRHLCMFCRFHSWNHSNGFPSSVHTPPVVSNGSCWYSQGWISCPSQTHRTSWTTASHWSMCTSRFEATWPWRTSWRSVTTWPSQRFDRSAAGLSPSACSCRSWSPRHSTRCVGVGRASSPWSCRSRTFRSIPPESPGHSKLTSTVPSLSERGEPPGRQWVSVYAR